MNKSFRLFLALLLISGFALSFSSCKDSENVSNDPNSPENIALSKESESAVALAKILSYTSELDSLPDNWASNSYTVEPTVGTVLDESTPYVRYIATNNKEGAIDHYNSIVTEKITKDANSAKQNIENVGSLSFQVLDQPDVIATLDINIKQQPHLTQIRFVPASALGTNAGGTPYYSFGDVVSLDEGNGKISYWVCARPCSKISGKKMSHWFSFQLNDLGAANSNFIKFEKTYYPDYILPTDLGIEGKAEQHIPNLIKLLAKLSLPNGFEIKNGLGELKQSEFSEEKQADVTYYWERFNLFKKVLPISKYDFQQILTQDGIFGVFYHGYSYSAIRNFNNDPHVWMSKVDIPLDNEVISVDKFTFKSGKIGWKRTQDIGIDFRSYANNGRQSQSVNSFVPDLPAAGLIVRYKSGNQLIGKTGNDKDMTKSFTAFSNNIKEEYVYNKVKEEDKHGMAVLGDYITFTNKQAEICALNSSELTENYSLFFKYWDQNQSEKYTLQPLNFAKYAYINLMMDLSSWDALNYMDADEAAIFENTWENSITKYYRMAILSISKNIIFNSNETLTDRKALKTLVSFKYDKSGKYFSLTFPYDKEGTYAEAELRYYWKQGTYSVIPTLGKFDKYKSFLSLKSYKDYQGKMTLTDGGELSIDISGDDRNKCQEQTIDFIKNIKFQ